MKRVFYGIALSAAISTTPAAAAEFVFDFDGPSLFGGADITGSGIFTVSDTPSTVNGQEAFAITNISGLLNGSAITGLVPGIFGADNFFYKTEFFVRGQGIGFRNAAGTTANLFQTSGSRYRVNTVSPFNSAIVTANVSEVQVNGAVPEPATWAMMLLGFGFVGGAMRSAKRRQKLTVSYA